MPTINQYGVHSFNERHSVSEQQQFRALIEEVGELAEALNTEAGDDAVAEELADIIFVARSLAELRDIDISHVVNETIAENSDKDATTNGQKVTKDGLDTDYEITD